MRNLVIVSLFTTLCTASAAIHAATLAGLQGRYRVIAVFAPTDTDGADARDSLARATGIDERDIAWFVVTPSGTQSNVGQAVDRDALLTLHDSDGFEAILVGKDGGVKKRQSGTLDVAAFFQAIDAMPMRRQEMQSSQ